MKGTSVMGTSSESYQIWTSLLCRLAPYLHVLSSSVLCQIFMCRAGIRKKLRSDWMIRERERTGRRVCAHFFFLSFSLFDRLYIPCLSQKIGSDLLSIWLACCRMSTGFNIFFTFSQSPWASVAFFRCRNKPFKKCHEPWFPDEACSSWPSLFSPLQRQRLLWRSCVLQCPEHSKVCNRNRAPICGGMDLPKAFVKKRFIQNDCLCHDASKTFILLLLSHGLYDVHFFL